MTLLTALMFLLGVSAFQLSYGAHRAVGALIEGAGLVLFVILLRKVYAMASARVGERARKRIAYTGVTLAVGGAAVAVLGFGFVALAGEEVLLVLVLLGAAIALVGATEPRLLERSALLSMLGVIFSLPGIDEQHRLPLIVTTTVCGASWLAISSLPPRDAIGQRGWSVAYATVAIILVTTICVLSARLIQPTDGNPWYAAWVPASGGDQAGDENARRGVGDGPDEISSDNPASIGFDQSDNFSESGRDGLYDLWVESYGEPVKPGEQQKMVGLRPDDVRVVQAQDRENLKTGRTFELNRVAPATRPVERPDQGAEARVWVKGDMPVYLPLAAFVEHDGQSWFELPVGPRVVPVRRLDTGWMEVLDRPISPAFDGEIEYQVRVGTLGGAVLPLPPLVESFKMGRVNRPEFFNAMRSGHIQLAARTLPAGATLDVRCKRVSPRRLEPVEIALPRHTDGSLLDTRGAGPRVALIAREWAGDTERGWRQVERVMMTLREHVTHDPSRAQVESSTTAQSPDEAPPFTMTETLLLESRRGPDHHIATSAVMLLRSLGYPTRLVSGLYADASDVNEQSGFAALDARHAHFWIEVRLADGTWITVDPTPGYPLLNLPRPVGQWLTDTLAMSARFAWTHALTIALVAMCVVACVMLRKWVYDALVTARCYLRGCRSVDVLHVLEVRAALSRAGRPSFMPVGQWLRRFTPALVAPDYIDDLNRALYGQSVNRPRTRDVGRATLRRFTRRALKRARREKSFAFHEAS